MSRWHDPDCWAPDVVLDSQSDLPVCRACGMSFAKSRASVHGQSALQIPQDEAPGSKLNLCWPATVNYKRPEYPNQARYSQDSYIPYSQGNQPSGETAFSLPLRNSVPPPPSRLCYAPRLSQNQIRLLRISAPDRSVESSFDTTISHVSLEVYEHDQCPEYETMSYTWGGENGDSTPSQPVFVGSYWDVVWQTRNCCAMLHYLRPVEGFRLVWVDALCINQQDSREREQQVALMARIYEEARRVVVYLGSDLVTPTPGKHPRRRNLQDSIVPGAYSHSRPQSPASDSHIPADKVAYIDSRGLNMNHYDAHGNIDLVALMQRRYFSRIWVVQELALSRQVTIAVGNFEVWADALTPQKLKRNHPGWRWEDTNAPWLQNMAQREIPGMDLYQIMRATANSGSSDPRDRVFGVFALLGAGGRGLEPDYSLSPLQCFLGTCAHLILNLGHAELFLSAAGLAAQSPRPSWMPDYRSADWVRILHIDDETEVGVERDPLYKWLNAKLGSSSRDSSRRSSRQSLEEIPENSSEVSEGSEGSEVSDGQPTVLFQRLYKVSAEALRLQTDKELYQQSRPTRLRLLNKDELPPQTYTVEMPYETPRWNSQTSVDTETGSMTLDLIHLLQFRTVPTRMSGVPEHIRNPVFEVEGICDAEDETWTAMYLVTDGFDLSTVRPRTDHLYILDRQNGKCLFLVLRETAYRTSKLVACVRQVWFSADPGSWIRSQAENAYSSYPEKYRDADSTRLTLAHVNRLFLSDLQCSLLSKYKLQRLLPVIDGDHRHTEEALLMRSLMLDPPTKFYDSDQFYYRTTPFEVTSRDIAQFCQGIINELRGDSPGVLSSYAALFNPELDAVVRDDCVELTIQPSSWESMQVWLYDTETPLFKEWRLVQNSDTKPWSASRYKPSLLRRNKAVCVRARRADIMTMAVKLYGYELLSRFSYARKLTGKTEAEMYTHKGPYTDDMHSGCSNIASPVWPEIIVDGFRIDGSTYKVTIA